MRINCSSIIPLGPGASYPVVFLARFLVLALLCKFATRRVGPPRSARGNEACGDQLFCEHACSVCGSARARRLFWHSENRRAGFGHSESRLARLGALRVPAPASGGTARLLLRALRRPKL